MPQLEDKEWGNERYKAFLKEREALNNIRLKQQDGLDRSILTLSSAGVGLSVSLWRFGDSMLRTVSASFLSIAWTAFAVALLSTTLSFYLSRKGHERAIEMAEERYSTKDYLRRQTNKWDLRLSIANACSILSFAIGILALIGFGFSMFSHYHQT